MLYIIRKAKSLPEACRGLILERNKEVEQQLCSRTAQIVVFCAASLNLTDYTGVYGGKWCSSNYDPPPVANQTQKPDCPFFNSTVLPAIVPVQLPPIAELRDGNIFTAATHADPYPAPLVLKVIRQFSFDRTAVENGPMRSSSCERLLILLLFN